MILETIIISLSILSAGVYLGHAIDKAFGDHFHEDGEAQVVDRPEKMADQSEEVPDQQETSSDEIEYGSDALHQKNKELDSRIEALKKDLEQSPGTIYPEDHSIVDKQYIQIPPEEYAK